MKQCLYCLRMPHTETVKKMLSLVAYKDGGSQNRLFIEKGGS